ncbi:long-chain fatty acid transport protein 4-like [Phlebotomus papatasi]|uniref:long-chain fatty acid transport protein 4-like n=1 Tax=Phlebotomus papatasi TaxID=29031 RepID=UPI002483A213|nr:long-chain fatty acid transport protein 4-like [Phlebotomus papatasi]
MNNNNNQLKPNLEDVEKGQGMPPPANGADQHRVARRGSTADEVGKQHAVYCRVAIIAVGFVCLVAIVTLLWYFMGWIWGLQALLVAILVAFAASGLWRWFYIAALTAPRDMKALFRYIKLLLLVKKLQRSNATVADVFAEHVAKTPHKSCFVFEGRTWTFREVDEFSNRVANVFHSHGYKHGDVVGLLLENRPEFIAIWMGLSRLGVIVPLINHNLRQASLLHSVTVAKCNALIFGESLIEAVEEILPTMPSSVSLYQFNDAANGKCQSTAKDLTSLMLAASKDRPTAKKANHHDRLLYIYTSGTTGMPKAAVITHSRYIFICAAIHHLAKFRQDDIFYTPLPLYHTAGGIMNAGQAILFGATVVIRKKFSASGYFPDCQKYKCTVAQYIGEMCRYVLATPPSPSDKAHQIRLVFGNGLRPQIWPQFVERFKIPRVAEFYGATEGNANIVNIDNTVGAIGFVSRIIPQVYPISIIRADPATGEPIRGRNGLCQLCKPNEPGVFIGKIIEGNPSRAFLGYVDKAASEKKIVRDIFKKGDSAFLSGDLLTADERGNLYFKDRTGDTFRWKGENVSTSEVEAQVSNVAGYRDAVVFGVEIPNLEGRAGMTAILDPERTVDLKALADGLRKALPTYARPLFVRLLVKVDMTGTFKLKKLDLQNEGFNPEIVTDPLYYLTSKGQYEELTMDAYAKICSGEIRF